MLRVARFKVKFNKNRFDSLIYRCAIAAMEKAGKRLVEIMEREALVSNGKGPGKEKWREDIASMMKIISKVITKDALNYVVGYSGAGTVVGDLKAMIIDQGIGPASGGDVIWAGPPGSPVFGSNLEPKRSDAKSTYAIPQFSQEGNEWFQNSYELFSQEYEEIILSELNGLTQEDIAGCFSIEVRR